MVKILTILFLVQAVKSTPQGVKFEYFNPQAKVVYLAGDFNNWSTTANPMRRESDGTFWLVMKLPPGKYEYKFVVDGQYTADPDNPVTVGVYGNSLVRVGENYSVLPPEMATNTPVSSVVNFGLDARGYLKLDRDTLEGGRFQYRTFDFMEDLKLDVKANLEDKADLWVRIRYNTKQYREQSTQLIPIKFERGLLTMKGGNFNFFGFYNAHEIKGPDPFRLLSEVGEFRRDFGDGEQGVMINFNNLLVLQNVVLAYSNNIIQDRDLIYATVGRELSWFKLGLVYRGQKGLNKLYRVPSPDSLSEGGNLLFFNTYENENLYGGYLTYQGEKVYVSSGGMFGDRKLMAGERYRDDTPYPVDISWSKSRILKGFANLKGLFGRWINSAFLDYEKHYYDNLFIAEGSKYYKYWRAGAGTSYNGYFGLNLRYNILKTDSFMKWEYLFDDLENQRIAYGEFPLIGYSHYLTLNPFLKLNFKKINFRYDGKLNAFALNQKPYTLENVFHLDFQVFKPVVTYEFRTYTINSSFLNINKTYVDHFAEIAYPVGKNAWLSVNYGYLPWNLEDEYFARREYTMDQGVDYNLLKNNFRGLGTFVDLGESALSREKGVQLWLKIIF